MAGAKKKGGKGKAKKAPELKVAKRLEAAGVHLAACTRDYAIARLSPFDFVRSSAELPCVPDLITLPSGKFMITAKGVFSTGVSGVGAVALNPYDPTSDGTAIAHTISSTVCSSASILSTVAPVTIAPISPLVAADLAVNYGSFRCVGLGLKILYAGTELNKGGTVTCYREPSNGDLYSYMTMSLAWKEPASVVVRDKGQEHVLLWSPGAANDLGYRNRAGGWYPMVIFVESATTSAQPYHYEVVGLYESIGTTKLGNTSSSSDPVGISGVAEASSDFARVVSKIDPQRALSAVERAIQYTTSFATVLGSLRARRQQQQMLEL